VSDVDLGGEDFEFPALEELDIPSVARLWYDLDQAATAANKRAARLKERRAAVKDLAIEVVRASGQTGGSAEVGDGREVQITPYAWEVFQIVNEEQFKEWAAGEVENYYDSTPRLRESIFLDHMRKLSQDRAPLPPGVKRWEDIRISRTAKPRRRLPAQGGPGTEQGPQD
jgi:Arc/MetJ family transcription regulator